MARHEHYIAPTKGNAQPQSIVCLHATLDTSSTGPSGEWCHERVARINAIGWTEGNGRESRSHGLETTHINEWYGWLLDRIKPGRLTWLFAFGLKRQLSALHFWDKLESGEYYLTGQDPMQARPADAGRGKGWQGYCILQDPPSVILCRPSGKAGSLKLLDIRNYGVRDLGSLGDHPNIALRIARWISGVIEWLKGNELGSLKNTAGSQAASIWRRKYLDVPVLCHQNEDALKLEERAFYGGRCEAAYIGEVQGPIWHLDYNSGYASAVVGQHVPVELVQYEQYREPKKWIADNSPYLRLATVQVETERPDYPLRLKHNIIWPVGKFWTTLAGPELTHAAMAGRIKQISDCSWYKGSDCLTDYMADLYAARLACGKNQNRAGDQFMKQMLVALPGKFFQRQLAWIDAPHKIATQPWHIWYERDGENGPMRRYRTIAWLNQMEADLGWHREAVPAIAAWITSLARIRLLQAIQACPRQSVYYWDTDSLHVSREGFDALSAAGAIDGRSIGGLKVVGTYQRVQYHGIKHYMADGHLVCAGLSVGSNGGLAPLPINADLAIGKAPMPIVRMLGINPHGEYRHGIVGDDGWIRPFDMSNTGPLRTQS